MRGSVTFIGFIILIIGAVMAAGSLGYLPFGMPADVGGIPSIGLGAGTAILGLVIMIGGIRMY